MSSGDLQQPACLKPTAIDSTHSEAREAQVVLKIWGRKRCYSQSHSLNRISTFSLWQLQFIRLSVRRTDSQSRSRIVSWTVSQSERVRALETKKRLDLQRNHSCRCHSTSQLSSAQLFFTCAVHVVRVVCVLITKPFKNEINSRRSVIGGRLSWAAAAVGTWRPIEAQLEYKKTAKNSQDAQPIRCRLK